MTTFTQDENGVSQAEYNWMQSGVADDKGMTAKPCNVLAECLLPWSIKDSLAGRKQAKKKSATTLTEERKCMSGAPPERASDKKSATAPKGESQPPCCGCIQEKPPSEKPSVSIATMVRQIAAAAQPVEAAAVLFLLYASYDTKPEMVPQAACGMAVGIAAALDLHAQNMGRCRMLSALAASVLSWRPGAAGCIMSIAFATAAWAYPTFAPKARALAACERDRYDLDHVNRLGQD
jgi:hypothetical protein